MSERIEISLKDILSTIHVSMHVKGITNYNIANKGLGYLVSRDNKTVEVNLITISRFLDYLFNRCLKE